MDFNFISLIIYVDILCNSVNYMYNHAVSVLARDRCMPGIYIQIQILYQRTFVWIWKDTKWTVAYAGFLQGRCFTIGCRPWWLLFLRHPMKKLGQFSRHMVGVCSYMTNLYDKRARKKEKKQQKKNKKHRAKGGCLNPSNKPPPCIRVHKCTSLSDANISYAEHVLVVIIILSLKRWLSVMQWVLKRCLCHTYL